MKLRNKKTGEIVELFNNTDNILPDTLAELKEDWEDYKPDEPLIKDEKVRKAVRAWADKQDITICRVADGNCLVNYPAIISFLGTPFADLKNREYTIAELCGEEE